MDKVRDFLRSTNQESLQGFVNECVTDILDELRLGKEEFDEGWLYQSSLECVLEHRAPGKELVR